MKLVYPYNNRNGRLLCNRIFIAGLLVLALNDHYLKLHYAGWLTGKLSDFAGLLIFPMFLLYLLPRLGTKAVWLAGILFVWWKSPLSGGFIDLYNNIAPIQICRVVDYTDLIALAILPVSRYVILHIQRFTISIALHPVLLLLPASLVFMATSPPRSMYFRPGGDVVIDRSFKTGLTKEAMLEKLRAAGYVIEKDTDMSDYERRSHYWGERYPDSMKMPDSARAVYWKYHNGTPHELYRLSNITLPNTKDTIDHILFNCYDKSLYIEQIKFRHKVHYSSKRIRRQYRKQYKKVLKEELVEKMKGE